MRCFKMFGTYAALGLMTLATTAVFTPQAVAVIGGCVDDTDCDDGRDCNGAERCNLIKSVSAGGGSGVCEPGNYEDCNSNGLPDACEIEDGDELDCDGNGVPDICDIAGGATDCNGNGIPDVCDLTGRSIDQVLSNLNNGVGADVSSLIPSPFNFTGGDSSDDEFCGNVNNNISDGGNDMYDCGNRLTTNLSVEFVYTDGNLVTSDGIFGPGSSYHTSKFPALFVMQADNISIDMFEITGNLGADGDGSMDTAMFDVTEAGRQATVYVKRVFSAGDPSINHIIIVPGDGSGITHTFSTNTNQDRDTLTGLAGINHITYLLVARSNGLRLSDEDVLDLVDEFESGAGLSIRDCNGNQIPDDCDIANGTSADVDSNGTPDECQSDCNSNAIPDRYEVRSEQAPDCNNNRNPDECDIEEGTSDDCNNNSIPDECNDGADCNLNGILDECDFASGVSNDCNANGISDVCDLIDGSIEQALALLDNGLGANVSDLIPDRFNFTGGDSSDDEFCGDVNNNISDGGNDMYDCGNYLSTDMADRFPYTDGVIVPSDDIFGPGSSYFTAKFPGLFVMQASGISIDMFEIDGNNGADDDGGQDDAMLNLLISGHQFTVYVKRVFGAGDPSINHIIIVSGDGTGITHTFSDCTDDDLDTLEGLVGVDHITYLLVARTGQRLSDEDVLAIAKRIQTRTRLGSQNSSEDTNDNGIPDECENRGGGAIESGFGFTDGNGFFSATATTSSQQPLARVTMNSNEGQDRVDWGVDPVQIDGPPGPGTGTFAGFANGQSLARTLTVTTNAVAGQFVATVEIIFTQAELNTAGIVPEDVSIQVLDEEATPQTWGPAGTNDLGEAMPTGVVGDFGFFRDSAARVVFWVVRDELSIYAVGAAEPTPAQEPPAPQPEPDPGQPVPTDTDGDGVDDDADLCPDTTAGAMVDETGCEVVMDPPVDMQDMTNQCGEGVCGTLGGGAMIFMLMGLVGMRSSLRRRTNRH